MSGSVSETIEAAKEVLVGSEQAPSMTAEARRSFLRFADSDDHGQFMTTEGFVNALTASSPHEDFHKIPREQYAILFLAAGEAFVYDFGIPGSLTSCRPQKARSNHTC